MELTIGVQNVARHLTIDVDDAENVVKEIEAAISSGQASITITDSKGGLVLLPVAAVGYVQTDPQSTRPVGFGRV